MSLSALKPFWFLASLLSPLQLQSPHLLHQILVSLTVSPLPLHLPIMQQYANKMVDIEYGGIHFNGFFHSLSFAVPQVNRKVDELAVLADQFFKRSLVKKFLCLLLHEQAE